MTNIIGRWNEAADLDRRAVGADGGRSFGSATGSTAKRLAIFSPSEPETLMNEGSENRYYRALFSQLRRLGYVERVSLTVERWCRERSIDGQAALAASVIRSAPDVGYVVGPGALLFKQAATRLPIVALTGDPIAGSLAEA